jgi:hypothetical protein
MIGDDSFIVKKQPFTLRRIFGPTPLGQLHQLDMGEADVVIGHIDPPINMRARVDHATMSSWLVTSARTALAVPFQSDDLNAFVRGILVHIGTYDHRAFPANSLLPFPQPGPTDQWGLPRQDAAPRNPHHCSTNCRDTTDARNTPWMGNKGRDILKAVANIRRCWRWGEVVHAERPTSRAATRIILITFPPIFSF